MHKNDIALTSLMYELFLYKFRQKHNNSSDTILRYIEKRKIIINYTGMRIYITVK